MRSPILEVVSYSKLGPALANPIGWGLHLGVGAGADNIDAPLLTVHDASLQRQLPEGFESLGPRGVVLLGHYRRELLRFYERSGVSTVLVDWPESSWKGHAVYVDNAGATEDAVRRLLAMGHRHIAFVQRLSLVQGDLDLDAKERAKSLLRALKKAGAAPGREVVFTISHRDGDESPALERLLKARPAFSAVLTSDGAQAARIIEAARAAGRSVPGDLSVASFQPIEGEAPGLSGPCIDFEAMGREAVGLLQHPARPARQRRFPAVWRAGKTATARRQGRPRRPAGCGRSGPNSDSRAGSPGTPWAGSGSCRRPRGPRPPGTRG